MLIYKPFRFYLKGLLVRRKDRDNSTRRELDSIANYELIKTIAQKVDILFKRPKKIKKLEIYKLYAIALYEVGLPFIAFANLLAFKDFIYALNLDYSIPSRERLSEDLLQSYYLDVKVDLEKIIRAQRPNPTDDRVVPYLNFISDKSTLTGKARIANISLNVNEGQAFYIETTNTLNTT